MALDGRLFTSPTATQPNSPKVPDPLMERLHRDQKDGQQLHDELAMELGLTSPNMDPRLGAAAIALVKDRTQLMPAVPSDDPSFLPRPGQWKIVCDME
jgi:hypothetical protein